MHSAIEQLTIKKIKKKRHRKYENEKTEQNGKRGE